MTKQIWFLTGSQELYGPETLAQVAEQSQAVVNGIAAKLGSPIELVWKPVLKTSDAIRRTMLDASSGIETPPHLRTLRLEGRSLDSGINSSSCAAVTAATAAAMAVVS